MKIVKTVRDMHRECLELYEGLAGDVEQTLKPAVEKCGWFFISRIKQIESYSLKIETGRFQDPGRLEDFYASTIVVPTLTHIDAAVSLVDERYTVEMRRPKDERRTHKRSSSFEFDDLRLYVKRRPPKSGTHPEWNDLLFEIQVKTILQHAWGLATHDLVYKTESPSWARERIAYQVKAMLEHAEVAIATVDSLAEASAVARIDEHTQKVAQFVDAIKKVWKKDQLPKDLKRLAENIIALLSIVNADTVDHFLKIVVAEKSRIGILPTDLSPYSFCVQAVAWHPDYKLEERIAKSRSAVVIHSGMELPNWMRAAQHPKIVDLGGT